METKVNYYSDELNDDFAGIVRDTITIDENYKYSHRNIFYRMGAFVLYRIIMTPVAYLYLKFKFNCKFVGKEKLKPFKNESIFIYGNHTQLPGDGYIPSIAAFPKKCSVIVNADNVSLKGTKTFMEMIGAFPLPNQLGGMRPFLRELKEKVNRRDAVVIYPEAHIWPYYTGIRAYKDGAFKYPVDYGCPVFSFTTTYQKRENKDIPAMTVYIDGPFYPNADLKKNEAKKELRDKVYNTMVERSKNSNYDYIKYEYRGNDDEHR